ncbi:MULTISPECIES: MFS transporter [Pseudoalteromonas]|jgi:fucose permease|uniref:MFS transporter n=1 Tax=Pseudoalteromonas tetraodonis TaxID=43659 RepID=A0ABD4EML1_9GAMM|nr:MULTISPECIES: MFS transporter [Pseudoalteromonas]KYL32963.1 MFS transporter [Pseudoalteromonas spiralis]MDN3395204.1 MFS transporter [Pseudoalteromonas sp. APC 3215]MDN3400024.1 MFS transporter [Pseudoalteromonas sp. APC 3213]MDN3405576.1 MFS transporter [Pseudoalteromonas sp. APC 3218]MDN3409243.1 MFS transporter [Pseudoalteromonas sp. APC 3894]|tara:strand:+ start:83966 stop:85204 length:1239 start_codon:yes stop_codon:yes gene_type:complete
MSKIKITLAIAASYFIFAILLNSVGTVILQAINTLGVSKTEASVLEGFKDLSIAIMSFVVASFIPRLGYKLAMLLALIVVVIACLSTAVISDFYMFKVLFAAVGCGFAVVKVSVYSIIGQVTEDANSHSSLLNTIEGIFMVGVLSGYWVFTAFIDPVDSNAWLNVYYVLAALTLLVIISVVIAPIKPAIKGQKSNSGWNDFIAMLKLTYQPLVLIFIISAFLYVLIEQGVGTWLPTFNNQVLQLPVAISIQLASIFAAALALGRLVAGQVLKHIHWFVVLSCCLVAMAALIIITLPLTENLPKSEVNSLFDAPLAAFVLPLIGFFMAPIYPVLNSVMLSALQKHQHAAMTGLIVVFSALGGTTGSVITGYVFEHFSGQHAFYLSLVPISLIFISVIIFKKRTHAISQHAVNS